MTRDGITALLLLVAASGLPLARADEAQERSRTTLELCKLQVDGPRRVGKTVTMTGVLKQEITFAYLWDTNCPEITVRVNTASGVPDPLECMSGHATTDCGGLSHNGQLIVLIGTLTSAPKHIQLKEKTSLWTPAVLEVIRYESPSAQQPRRPGVRAGMHQEP